MKTRIKHSLYHAPAIFPRLVRMVAAGCLAKRSAVQQAGFTLVELAIVLVVVSLLLVAVLSGQSLIDAARAKDVLAIVEDFRAATASFKRRYNYLPGDWPYSASEIAGVTASPGNGDGAIDGAVDAQGKAAAGSEVAAAPLQLFNAGFLGKIDASDPQRRISTSFGAVHLVSAATANGLVPAFGAQNPAARNAIVFFNLPCDIANEVDAKMDNGDLASGRAVAVPTACAPGTSVRRFAVAL